MGKERGWGVFEGAESIFFRWFAPKLRVGGCSRNCVLPRGSAPRPRTLHPIGGSEKLETLYAASQEIDFDDDLRKAATVSFKDTVGNDRQSLFFLCADGKAQVLMAGCQNWKAESPGATVCSVCMRNRALCLATFGKASAIDGNWEPAVAINAVYRTITIDRRVPDYGLHGVLRVLLCAVNGTRDLVVQLTGKAPATVARTMLQPVLDEARLAA